MVETSTRRDNRIFGEIPSAEFARQLGVYAQLTGQQETED